MPKIIVLASGKGGAGKTGVAAAIGCLLARSGFRTLLVDGDVATHGLSVFLSYLGHANVRGLSDVTDVERVDLIPVPVEAKGREELDIGTLSVVLTTSNYEANKPVSDEDQIAARLMALVSSGRCQEYDYIIIDCQAGMSLTLSSVLKVADHVLVLTEADPVSVQAVSGLFYSLKNIPGKSNTKIWGLVNKVFPDEQQYYEALTDVLRHVPFLGLLPFDSVVRRAYFQRRGLSGLLESPPFKLALAQALMEIDPRIAQRFSERNLDTEISHDAEREFTQLNELRKQLLDQYLDTSVRVQQYRRLGWFTISSAIGTFAVIMAITLIWRPGFTNGRLIVLATGAAASAAVFAWQYFRLKGTAEAKILEYEMHRLRSQLERLDERLGEFEIGSERKQSPSL